MTQTLLIKKKQGVPSFESRLKREIQILVDH